MCSLTRTCTPARPARFSPLQSNYAKCRAYLVSANREHELKECSDAHVWV